MKFEKGLLEEPLTKMSQSLKSELTMASEASMSNKKRYKYIIYT
jgi:hypothetical protein